MSVMSSAVYSECASDSLPKNWCFWAVPQRGRRLNRIMSLRRAVKEVFWAERIGRLQKGHRACL